MDSIGIALTLGPQQSWDQQNGIRGRVQGRGLDWTDDDYMVHNNGLGVTATVDLHSTAWYAAIVWELQLRRTRPELHGTQRLFGSYNSGDF